MPLDKLYAVVQPKADPSAQIHQEKIMQFRYIDMDRIIREQDAMRDRFRSAEPFELLVIDDFLTPAGLEALEVEKLLKIPSSKEFSSDYMFAKNKIENPKLATISEGLSQLREELLSDQFRDFLSHIYGQEIFLDPKFAGGGLHQGGSGSFLEMHADFSRHPNQREWIRELNLLLYLNRDWDESWGGQLDLKNKNTGALTSVEPIENRMVIMLSKGHTVHGYKPITFPEGMLRTSIAAYAYSMDDGTQHVPYRSTEWQPSDTGKRLFATFWNRIVPIKQRLFGSRTAKRAEDGEG